MNCSLIIGGNHIVNRWKGWRGWNGCKEENGRGEGSRRRRQGEERVRIGSMVKEQCMRSTQGKLVISRRGIGRERRREREEEGERGGGR